MDYLDNDMKRLIKIMQGKLNQSNISRGKDLDMLEKIVDQFPFTVALYSLDSPVPFFISNRFFRNIGKKKGASEYTVADFYSLLNKGGSHAHHGLFLDHFNQKNAASFRTIYKFINAKGKPLWLTACSCLISGKDHEPIILSLLFGNEQSLDIQQQMLSDISIGIDTDELEKKLSAFSVRELQVFECLGYEMDIETAANHLFIARSTYKTHVKHVRGKIGEPYKDQLSRSFFSHKYARSINKCKTPQKG